jgi:hypothetical protein
MNDINVRNTVIRLAKIDRITHVIGLDEETLIERQTILTNLESRLIVEVDGNEFKFINHEGVKSSWEILYKSTRDEA